MKIPLNYNFAPSLPLIVRDGNIDMTQLDDPHVRKKVRDILIYRIRWHVKVQPTICSSHMLACWLIIKKQKN